MPQARINCPNCKQPIMADVNQIFDVGEDPSAKTRLLSGISNFVQCQFCGYQGTLATPIVYHDPDKELLLTYIPAEIGLPRDEQERLLGSLINQVVNRLPPEKRKAYLLTPQAHLTLRGLVERILEADGITKEMIKAQQDKLDLLQRLSSTSNEKARLEILRKDESLVDADLFNLLSRLLGTAAATGDQESARQLENIQNLIIENTEFGRQVKQQTEEVRAAVASLQEAGKELTREKLLELVKQAPNEIRLSALVSLARTGMDYTFFQMLTKEIDSAKGEEQERLIALRERLLEMTSQIDAQVQVRARQSRQLLNQILQADNVSEVLQQSAPQIDEFFMQAVQEALEESRKSGDLERITKLNQINETIQEITAPPAEITFLEELLEASDEQSRQKILDENPDKVTPEFFQVLSGVMAQVVDSDQQPELIEELKAINRQALRYSMQLKIQGE